MATSTAKSLGMFLAVCLAAVSVASALKCYNCPFGTGPCTQTADCTTEDSCLILTDQVKGTVRQCYQYAKCDYNTLGINFPQITNFKYSCCQTNLCNSSTAVAAGKPLLAAVLSLMVFCWML